MDQTATKANADRKYAPLTITTEDGHVFNISRKLICSKSGTLARCIKERSDGGNISTFWFKSVVVDRMLQFLHEGDYDLASELLSTDHVEKETNRSTNPTGTNDDSNYLLRHCEVWWVAFWFDLFDLMDLSIRKFQEELEEIWWPTENCQEVIYEAYHIIDYDLHTALVDKSLANLEELMECSDAGEFEKSFLLSLVYRLAEERNAAAEKRLKRYQGPLRTSQDELQKNYSRIFWINTACWAMNTLLLCFFLWTILNLKIAVS